jgi:hypothetical protein
MIRVHLGLVLVATASAGLAVSVAAEELPTRDWYYCQLAERPYGRTVYLSDVFTRPAGVSEADVEAAFEDHVRRRYVRAPVAGALCLGPKVSSNAARRDRQDALASLRRDGVEIVRTDWQLRGSGGRSFPARSPR